MIYKVSDFERANTALYDELIESHDKLKYLNETADRAHALSKIIKD